MNNGMDRMNKALEICGKVQKRTDRTQAMAEALQGRKKETKETKETKEAQGRPKNLENLEEKIEIQGIKERQEIKGKPGNPGTREIRGTLTFMSPAQVHIDKGIEPQVKNQEGGIEKITGTHPETVKEVEEEKEEAVAEKEEEIEILTGTTGQAMGEGVAEKVTWRP